MKMRATAANAGAPKRNAARACRDRARCDGHHIE
jgi:hypothetical protein